MSKTERLGAVVNPAHKLALERMAAAEDVSGAVILRRLIRQEAQRRGMWPGPESAPAATVQTVQQVPAPAG